MATASSVVPTSMTPEELASQIADDVPGLVKTQFTPRTRFRKAVHKVIKQINAVKWVKSAVYEMQKIAETVDMTVEDLQKLRQKAEDDMRQGRPRGDAALIYNNILKYIEFVNSGAGMEEFKDPNYLQKSLGAARILGEFGAIAALARGMYEIPPPSLLEQVSQGAMAAAGSVTGWLSGLTPHAVELFAGFGSLMYPAYSAISTGVSAAATAFTGNELVSVGLIVALGLIYYRDDINNLLGIGQEIGQSRPNTESTLRYIQKVGDDNIDDIQNKISQAAVEEAELLAGAKDERKDMIQISLGILESSAKKLKAVGRQNLKERNKALIAARSALKVLTTFKQEHAGLKKIVADIDRIIGRRGQDIIDEFNKLKKRYKDINSDLNKHIADILELEKEITSTLERKFRDKGIVEGSKALSDGKLDTAVQYYLSPLVTSDIYRKKIKKQYIKYQGLIRGYNRLINEANELKTKMLKFGFSLVPGSWTAMGIYYGFKSASVATSKYVRAFKDSIIKIPENLTLLSASKKSYPKNVHMGRMIETRRTPSAASAASTTAAPRTRKSIRLHGLSTTSMPEANSGGSSSRRKSSRRQSKTVRRKSVRKNPSKKRSSKKTRRRR